MNIAEILKNTPKGTKLYSPLFGECELIEIIDDLDYPIRVYVNDHKESFAKDGKYYSDERFHDSECVLFPSKENRDWNTFKVEKSYEFKPFDKVLVRDTEAGTWFCDYFSHKDKDRYVCVGGICNYCIPYNDDTKHLIGTNKSFNY